MDKRIKQIIVHNDVHDIADLNDEGKILFEFLTLIVDIKYRHKYGKKITRGNNNGIWR